MAARRRRRNRFGKSAWMLSLLLLLIFFGKEHQAEIKEEFASDITGLATSLIQDFTESVHGEVSESADFVEKAETSDNKDTENNSENPIEETSDLSDIPAYAGYASITLHNNIPYFTDEEKENITSFETYSDLDSLGRCGVAYANLSRELQPTEERGAIGSVHPSGWHTVNYHDLIDGNYLYNRCHLIAFQLAGENANEKNLITGTRYLNVVGMLPYENEVADYLNENDAHVLYRVTPIFEGDNLVADGVLMEAYSVEDQGAGVQFCVYCYNVQPGIGIDYATGESWEDASVVSYDNHSYKSS